MAGDWLPIRLDLGDDPAVILISKVTGLDCHAVVGRLVNIWSWANRHTDDGRIRDVDGEWLDNRVGMPGFAAAMEQAGWLKRTAMGLSIPRFDRHNGPSAKHRALNTRRKSLSRSRRAASATDARPQNRREEKKREEKSNARSPEASTSSEARTHGAAGACPEDSKAGDHACVACRFPGPLLRVVDAINVSPISPRRRQSVIDDAKVIASTRNPMPLWKAIVKRAAARSKNPGGYIANAMKSEASEAGGSQ